MGIDNPQPRFSWILGDSSTGAVQSAWQILVAATPDELNEKNAGIWNSGKVASDESINIKYQGRPLQSGTRYFWKVRTWNKDGKVSDYSNH